MADTPYRTPDGAPRDPLEVIEEADSRVRGEHFNPPWRSAWRVGGGRELWMSADAVALSYIVPALLEELRESRRRVGDLEHEVARLRSLVVPLEGGDR